MEDRQHYRGDTRGEMRKDKDIKWEKIYEMRIEENKGQWRQESRRESLWPVVNPCFTDLAVTWLLRPAYCQTQAGLQSPPNTLNLHLKQLFIPFIRCLDPLIPVQGRRGSWTGAYPNINWVEGGPVLHMANKHLLHKRRAEL